jgi:type VI secretion system protein ImpF
MSSRSLPFHARSARSPWAGSFTESGESVASSDTNVWLRPSLLERLTDHHPDRRTESPEAGRVDDQTLRELIRRDLTWLFNTTHASASMDLSQFPEVARSILNYGVPDLVGRTPSSLHRPEFITEVKTALLEYEPRLIRESLAVRLVTGAVSARRASVVIEIEGELRTEPLPAAVRVRAEVDIDSGRVEIAKDGASEGR